MQPINISYIKESPSCYDEEPVIRPYEDCSVMNTLMRISPLTAFLAQKGKLDRTLDQPDFNGTIFACCKEYSKKNFEAFSKNVNHLQAKGIILSSMLPNRMHAVDILNEDQIPTMDRYTYLSITQNADSIIIDSKIKVIYPDIVCSNGIIHITNGIISSSFYTEI